MGSVNRTYTNPGNTVLDNCMGSGSTGVACINTEREFIGMELNPDYFGIAEKRIREAQTAAGKSTSPSFIHNRDEKTVSSAFSSQNH